MPASKAVIASTQIAARAVLEKMGRDLIAIDLSDQLVLSEVFLIVHIQSDELRRYYMLDRLWNDCPTIALDAVAEEKARG